jgi:hypothetical protein
MEHHTKLLQFRAPEFLSEAIDAAAKRELQTKSEYVAALSSTAFAPAVSIRRAWLPITYRSSRVTRSRQKRRPEAGWKVTRILWLPKPGGSPIWRAV